MAAAVALVVFDKLGTNGYYSERGVPFGFCRVLVLGRTPGPV